MGLEYDDLVIAKHLQLLLFGITFPIVCIICIAALVRRIRRRQSRYTPPPKRQMDPHSFPPDNKRGGEEHEENEEEPMGQQEKRVPYPRAPSLDLVTNLPSACDILQPLSQLAPLPSSGYLAAMLGRERSARNKQSSPCGAASPGDSSRPATSDTNDSSRYGSLSEGSDESRPEPEDPPHHQIEISPTGWRTGEGYYDEEQALDGAKSVQRRSQVAQNLYAVDEEQGIRAWRRLMVEYS